MINPELGNIINTYGSCIKVDWKSDWAGDATPQITTGYDFTSLDTKRPMTPPHLKKQLLAILLARAKLVTSRDITAKVHALVDKAKERAWNEFRRNAFGLDCGHGKWHNRRTPRENITFSIDVHNRGPCHDDLLVSESDEELPWAITHGTTESVRRGENLARK